MNKMYLIASILSILFSCSSANQGEIKLPKKIESLPVGIEVKHNLKQVYASTNEDYPTRGGKYKWKYKTSVKALTEDLKIVEFGGFILEENKWVEKNIERRPFNNQEFQEWYKCPDGMLKTGLNFTDSNNWGTSNEITDIDAKTLWYYIGINSENKKFVGYGEIEMIGELKE
jgi:hypothetical protein